MRYGFEMSTSALELESNECSGHSQVCLMSQYDSIAAAALQEVRTARKRHTTPVFGSHFGS